MEKPRLVHPFCVEVSGGFLNIHHPMRDHRGWTKHSTIYDIPLDHLKTQGQVMKWVGQIMEKNWCTPELLGAILYAIKELRGDFRGDW